LCAVKAKKANKNLQQRNLSGFKLFPSINYGGTISLFLILCLFSASTIYSLIHVFRISSVEEMARTGMYMSDLGMYDSSQEMVLSGIQPLPELEYARDQV